MSARSHNETFEAANDRRSSHRLWFEKVVVVPISFGMVAATLCHVLLRIVELQGHHLPEATAYVAGVSIFAAIGAAVVEWAMWLRR